MEHGKPLLHIVFPDTFEIIISANHKRLICAAFPDVAPAESDEDRKLLAIKKTLPPEPKTIWAFYRDGIEAQWKPKPPPEPQHTNANQRASAVTKPPATVEGVAESLYLDPAWLTEVRDVLFERGQIVLHGPPGTGKTRIARDLASALAPQERVHFVQFHPAYSYEDFIEGLRPKVGGGAGGFEVRQGPLRRIAAAAEASPSHRHILIIDEINRANLARVLGESLVHHVDHGHLWPPAPRSGSSKRGRLAGHHVGCLGSDWYDRRTGGSKGRSLKERWNQRAAPGAAHRKPRKPADVIARHRRTNRK